MKDCRSAKQSASESNEANEVRMCLTFHEFRGVTTNMKIAFDDKNHLFDVLALFKLKMKNYRNE